MPRCTFTYRIDTVFAGEEPFVAEGLAAQKILSTARRHRRWSCMWNLICMLLKWRASAGLGQHVRARMLPQSNAATPWLPQQPIPAMMPAPEVMPRLTTLTLLLYNVRHNDILLHN